VKLFMGIIIAVLLCGGTIEFSYKLRQDALKTALLADKKIQYITDETGMATTKLQLLDSTLINTFALLK